MAVNNTINTNVSGYFFILSLALTIIIIGTGISEAEVMPKDEILNTSLICILLVAGLIHYKRYLYIDRGLFVGFIIFNCFFILRVFLQDNLDIELKTYLIHLICLGSYVTIYTNCYTLLSSNNIFQPLQNKDLLSLLAFICLLILLAAQATELYLYNDMRLRTRPGGFLNPNTTAALAMMFIFIIAVLSRSRYKKLFIFAIAITFFILLLSKSRSVILAGMLFLPLFASWCFQNVTKRNFLLAIIGIISLIIILSVTNSINIIGYVIDRFIDDSSSNVPRISLLHKGWIAFLDEPLWGNGYRYVESIAQGSTHNEIIETLANFGLIGLTVILLSCYLLYFPFSLTFFIICMFPTLFFTHNFFDSYPIQAVLGVSMAADRYIQNKNI